MLAVEFLDTALLRAAPDKNDFRIHAHREALKSMLEAHHALRNMVDPASGDRWLAHATSDAERWKECVRILQLQSEMARVIPLLDRRPSRRMKQWWFSMTEVVAILRRNDFAAPSTPLRLPAWSRLRSMWQATFSKSTFHR